MPETARMKKVPLAKFAYSVLERIFQNFPILKYFPWLVSCPTKWSLYWPLVLCVDHLSILSTEGQGAAMYYTQPSLSHGWAIWLKDKFCSQRSAWHSIDFEHWFGTKLPPQTPPWQMVINGNWNIQKTLGGAGGSCQVSYLSRFYCLVVLHLEFRLENLQTIFLKCNCLSSRTHSFDS